MCESVEGWVQRAAVGQAAEAQTPRHLRHTRSGWPAVLPTPAEAQLLADVRRTVAAAVGITIRYTTGDGVRGRIAELMEANTRKLAEQEAVGVIFPRPLCRNLRER